MARQGSQTSVGSYSPTPNWREIHANPLSSWNSISRWLPQLPHAASSSEDDISPSAASFANAPSIASSSADLSGEPSDNHLWSQVLLSVGSNGDLSKTLGTEMFDPACDYLKKLEGGWEFTNPSPFNSLDRYDGGLIEHERMATLSDLVSNWSIAPPNPQLDHHITPSTCNASVNASMEQYSTLGISHTKHELWNTPSHTANGMVFDRTAGNYTQHHEMGSRKTSFLNPFSTDGIGYQIRLNNPWANTRNFADLRTFNGCFNNQELDFQAAKLSAKGSDSSDSRKQGYENSSSTRGSERGIGTTSVGKKKRSEDSSEAPFKKSKHESPTVSSLKLQAPKVKVLDKITVLHQIVSPFGKIATASVLLEAYKSIRFLHEQVQLLSDPYMKSSANMDYNSWGGLERKDKMEQKLGLRSRGLCLVPISFTPQVYRDDNGPDYWIPTYRGCL